MRRFPTPQKPVQDTARRRRHIIIAEELGAHLGVRAQLSRSKIEAEQDVEAYVCSVGYKEVVTFTVNDVARIGYAHSGAGIGSKHLVVYSEFIERVGIELKVCPFLYKIIVDAGRNNHRQNKGADPHLCSHEQPLHIPEVPAAANSDVNGRLGMRIEWLAEQ